MTARGILIAGLLVLLGAPAPSHAGRVKGGGSQLTVAGDRLAWTNTAFQGDHTIESAPPDGPVSRLWSAPDDQSTYCDQVLQLAGSATRVAALYQHPGPDRCGPREVLAGPADGSLERVEMYVPDDRGCGPFPNAVALEGDRLVVLRADCDGVQIAIHDLAAGGPPRIVRPEAQFPPGDQIRIDGDQIAVAVPGGLFSRAAVLVLDLNTGRELHRVDVHDVSQAAEGGRIRFDFDAGGRVVFSAQAPDHPRNHLLYVATREDPAPRALPVALCSPHFGYDRAGQVFVCRRDTADLAVIDLAGGLKSIVDRARIEYGFLAFDGRRLGWMEAESHAGYVRNESWPYSAPEPPRPDPLGGGSGRQRPISSTPGAAVELAASGRRVLAVWVTGRSIVSRLLNRSGAPVGASRTISDPAPPGSLVVQPTVAGGLRGRFLVAWTGAGAGGAQASIRVRPVDARGRPTGPEHAMPAVDGETFAQSPSVVALGRGYLLAWQTERSDRGGRLLAVRLDASGRPAGTPQVVQERPAGSSTAGTDLVATGGGRAMLAWAHGDPGERRAILAQGLDAGGRRAGERMRLSAAGAPQADSVVLAHHAGTDRTLAVWREGDVPFSGDVRTAVLGSSGKRVGRSAALRGVGPDFRMAAAPAGPGFLVAGVRSGFLGDREVYAVAAGADGRARGKPFRVSRMGPDRTQARPDGRSEAGSLPALVRIGGDRLLAGWQGSDDGRAERIWARPIWDR